MGFREALNKGIDKEGKKSLKNDFINKMTFEFKSMVSLSESLEPLRVENGPYLKIQNTNLIR
jgi:hypothetical protein